MLKGGEMQIDRAKAIAEVAQVIVNTAKVEVEFIREVGGMGSNFIPIDDQSGARKLINGEYEQ